METLSIVFVEKKKVEIRKESFDSTLGKTEILCASIASLISTGTELQCLRGLFDKDTNWASWVKYPFYPGYSLVAEVLEVVRMFKASTKVIAYLLKDRIPNILKQKRSMQLYFLMRSSQRKASGLIYSKQHSLG